MIQPMIQIDGAYGEGGGQILRTSLALSLVTGKPFRIDRIRAKRKKPGLMRQHLTAVNAAAAVGGGQVTGGEVGSTSLTFIPGAVHAGRYHFSVGTAGSATLVFQTVLPALLMAEGTSEVTVEGGTHIPHAPPFDFIERSFLPVVHQTGHEVTATLTRPGFLPVGGGTFTAVIRPAGTAQPVELVERGRVHSTAARAVVAKLPRHIAERELKVIRERLSLRPDVLQVEEISHSRSPGNYVTVDVESDRLVEVFAGIGQRGVTAEKVAGRVVRAVKEYLAADVPVGPHLADQILIPLALAAGGRYRTLSPTLHTHTNMAVIRKFLDVEIQADPVNENRWEISVSPPPGS